MKLDHRDEAGVIEVRLGEQPVWAYRYADTPKPHVCLFATSSGHNAALVSPHDHVHHRGLMFASTVDDVNFWEERVVAAKVPVVGVIRHERWEAIRSDARRVELIESLSWVHEGQVMLREARTLAVCHEPDLRAVRCDWTTTLTAAGGRRSINGHTPYSQVSYHGLGFRFQRAMDWGGRHTNAVGVAGDAPPPGSPQASSRWHNYDGLLDGSHAAVGVWMGDSPANPRHPTPWFTLSQPPAAFAFVSASVMAHEPIVLDEGASVTLRYAVMTHDAHWDAPAGDRAWRTAFPTH